MAQTVKKERYRKSRLRPHSSFYFSGCHYKVPYPPAKLEIGVSNCEMLSTRYGDNFYVIDMKTGLPKPLKEAMIYEDKRLYACLANYPVVRGHVVVVWKKSVKDLHLLPKEDYEYLMDKVDQVRNAVLKTLKIRKVYLIYMDEVMHVHWHLIPRYNKKGLDVLEHTPSRIKDFPLAEKIKQNLATMI